MERRQGGAPAIAGLLGAFVAASTVLGLLAAGILMPVVGVGGMTAKSVVTAFDALPAQFTSGPMAQQSHILAADGSTIATLYRENRLVVPIDKISEDMQKAQVAIEDKRFYEHGGIDGRGIIRAFVSTASGDTQGASTLTQQYVRQLLIATARQSDNESAAEAAQARHGVAGIVRKLQEMKYAISMEQRMSKKEILEGYLNIVYYGAQSYGVEAAARRYFNTSADKLTLPQAAMIAGLAQNPGTADPINNPKRAIARRNAVLDAMQQQGMISRRRLAEAKKTPLALDVQQLKPSCPSSPNPYVCYFVVNWLLDDPALGKDRDEREKRLYFGGLNIHTTFDPKLLTRTSQILAARVPGDNWRRRGLAAAVVEPGTGRVVAIGQNTKWDAVGGNGTTSVNWAVDQKYGASGGFQIGSTAKMYAVVTAVEKGMTGGSSLYAPVDGTGYTASQLGADKCGMEFVGRYGPANAESNEHGMTTLREATVKSINTAFLELAQRVGVCNERETMKRMGLHRADGGEYGVVHDGAGGASATILGADNASPLTLAASYATLAAGGVYCEPRPVDKVVAFDGTKLPIGQNKCRRAISPETAYTTTKILTGVVTSGTGKKAALPDRPVAGKTGTSDASKQTWFVGYTPQLASAVWYGTPYEQRSVGAYGGTVAAPLFRQIMSVASKGTQPQKFRVVEDGAKSTDTAGAGAKKVSVPDVTGRGRNGATQVLERAGFRVVVDEDRVRSDRYPRGRVVETDPAVGSSVATGERITLRLSE